VAASNLTKKTINLVPAADRALDEAATVTGSSKTDVINQALKLYAFFLRMQDDGYTPCMEKEGRFERVHIL
jgi:predicted transcriptional regulator